MRIKRDYELSVWKEIFGVEDGDPTDQKVCVIGGSEMDFDGRAVEVALIRNINGLNELNFKMPVKCYSYLDGGIIDNPYISSLVNETRVKLRFKSDWFTFMVKGITKTRKGKELFLEYSCQDLFSCELSKSGWELSLSLEQENGIGELKELSDRVLAGTEWKTDIPVGAAFLKETDSVVFPVTQYSEQLGRVMTKYVTASGSGVEPTEYWGYTETFMLTTSTVKELAAFDENFENTDGWIEGENCSLSAGLINELDGTETIIDAVTLAGDGKTQLRIVEEIKENGVSYNSYKVFVNGVFDGNYAIDSNPIIAPAAEPTNTLNASLTAGTSAVFYNCGPSVNSVLFKTGDSYKLKMIADQSVSVEIGRVDKNGKWVSYSDTKTITASDNDPNTIDVTSVTLTIKSGIEGYGTLRFAIAANTKVSSVSFYQIIEESSPTTVKKPIETEETYYYKLTGTVYERVAPTDGVYVVKQSTKRRSISAEKSNRLNLTQELSKLFDCYASYIVEYDDNGAIKKGSKKVHYHDKEENMVLPGFTYGINLSGITRTDNSSGLVTKLFVESTESSLTDSGLCSIGYAEKNVSKEEYLIDLSYYKTTGVITKVEETAVNNTLTFVGSANENMRTQSLIISAAQSAIVQSNANLKIYKEKEKMLSEKIGEQTEILKDPTLSDELRDAAILALLNLALELPPITMAIANENANNSTNEDAIASATASLEYSRRLKQRLLNNLNQKYSTLLQEGVWSDSSYFEPDKYYTDALAVLKNSSSPQVEYSFDSIALDAIPGFENFSYSLGDFTTVTDKEFFGDAPVNVVITNLEYYLDEPEKDKIVFRNYDGDFSDMFDRMSASTQTLEMNEEIYRRSKNLTPTKEIEIQYVQNSLSNQDLTIVDSKNKTLRIGQDAVEAASINNPGRKVKLDGEGISYSRDGGLNWSPMITADGISANDVAGGNLNANLIKRGTLDANSVPIKAGGEVGENTTITLDTNGLVAKYKYSSGNEKTILEVKPNSSVMMANIQQGNIGKMEVDINQNLSYPRKGDKVCIQSFQPPVEHSDGRRETDPCSCFGDVVSVARDGTAVMMDETGIHITKAFASEGVPDEPVYYPIRGRGVSPIEVRGDMAFLHGEEMILPTPFICGDVNHTVFSSEEFDKISIHGNGMVGEVADLNIAPSSLPIGPQRQFSTGRGGYSIESVLAWCVLEIQRLRKKLIDEGVLPEDGNNEF